MQSLFHFAFHVTDLDQARKFYCGTLGCAEGRSTDTWVDIDFFGHQLSLHLGTPFSVANTGRVGEHMVPMPHFGAILSMTNWRAVATRLEKAGIDFILPPTIRFPGEPGEQGTLFFKDPCGNPIELKGFHDVEGVYAH